MALSMQAAARKGIPFVVLDRPNPIGGVIVEGALLDPAYASFIGMYPIPARHGMTVGELATLFNRQQGIGADLTVVPAQGWRRAQWFDKTGLPWVNRPPTSDRWRPSRATPARSTSRAPTSQRAAAPTGPSSRSGRRGLTQRRLPRR